MFLKVGRYELENYFRIVVTEQVMCGIDELKKDDLRYRCSIDVVYNAGLIGFSYIFDGIICRM
jgi:hypothetical protein